MYARQAYQRVEEGVSSGLETTLMSAFACEAFAFDLEQQAEFRKSSHPKMAELYVTLQNLERERKNTQQKFFDSYEVLTGECYDKSAEPWQAFATLITLRDRLVHPRPPRGGFVNGLAAAGKRDQKLLRRLASAGVIKN